MAPLSDEPVRSLTAYVQGLGDRVVYRFQGDHPRLVYGRGKSNPIVLRTERAARQHGAISIEAGRCCIEDFGTANGSIVGGVHLGRGRFHLRDGAELIVGDGRVSFQMNS